MGGGINGCALARLAARSGIRTVLLERRDFGCGVTSRSTRLIHGGLRYLESGQVSLVRESLRDRELLLREFPGQVSPQPFILPWYRGDSRPRWYLAAGLFLYRILAQGSGLPPPRGLAPGEILRLLPGLDPTGLVGGFEYHDCQAVYPERVALEMALQAGESGADIRNHSPVTGFVLAGSQVAGVRIAGSGGGEEIRSRVVVNAAGAWADRVLGLLPARKSRPLLTLLNGAHIVVEPPFGLPLHAVYREARSDRRPFFVVPWGGLLLVGTTETPYEGDPDRTRPEPAEIDYLLAEANGLFPEARLDRAAVLYAYCGPRPLLSSHRTDLNRVSRGHALIDHARRDGVGGLLTMAGGKLTTAPSFAAQALRSVARKLGVRLVPADGADRLPCRESAPARVARIYGPRTPELQRFIARSEQLAKPLTDGCKTRCGEVLFAVEREQARTLGDILLRRTGAAFDPAYDPMWARRAAEVAGPALGWSGEGIAAAMRECERELAEALPREQALG